jgi:uncharacterized protein
MTFSFAVPVLGDWLLSAPFSRTAALVNDRARRMAAPAGPAADFRLRAPKKLDPLFLGIIPTRGCNMACSYCGFRSARASAKPMDYAMAEAAVRWLAGNCRRRNKGTLNVHFFGGEPLYAFDVVEVAVHSARRLAAENGLVPHFEVCTNGFLSDAQTRFVGDYFHTVILSFDGPPEFQDRNRRLKGRDGSFDTVARTARALAEGPAQLCLRACVTHDSVSRMAEIATWFSREFRPSVVSWEVLRPTPQSRKARIFPPDPYAFARGFVASRRILEREGIRTVYAADLLPEPRFTFCPMGQDALVVTPEGRVNACYLPEEEWTESGLDLTIGRLDPQDGLDLFSAARRKIFHHVRNKPYCDGCFCRWSCAGGCHVQHTAPGRDVRASDFCIQTRIITACSLLQRLNEDSRVEALLSDRAALETLACQSSYLVGEII